MVAAAGPVDPRTLRTRARLRAALLAECEERALSQVSLAAVARRAGVGRATLYLHYDGLQALAVDACADIVRDGVDALHAWTGTPSAAAPPDPLVGFLTAVHRRADLYRTLLPDGGGGPLGTLLHRELRARSLAERVAAGAPCPELAAAAIAATFTGLLADWLHGQVPLGPADFAAYVWRLLLAVHNALR
ncbi:TetR/AcrR family transcriptional regulator [Streptomyces sp. NBC_01190]|uniref:TetR/AcrR family transcriptional regulator n=1 Tax=Streptomyces sp. NBC_01190 TaxID=2903767 RepID=UPI00386A940E|nr:TetR/AcrR family transcriptional regulator [Streptomyces sp. NBC_01190]